MCVCVCACVCMCVDERKRDLDVSGAILVQSFDNKGDVFHGERVDTHCKLPKQRGSTVLHVSYSLDSGIAVLAG